MKESNDDAIASAIAVVRKTHSDDGQSKTRADIHDNHLAGQGSPELFGVARRKARDVAGNEVVLN